MEYGYEKHDHLAGADCHPSAYPTAVPSVFSRAPGDEPGADEVAALLQQAQRGEVNCHGCFISLMEVFYRVWKDEGESAGRLAHRQCQSLPMTWIHETPALMEKAAELKVRHPISLADAWIAAAALLEQADLVHKDPEFEVIAAPQLCLPYQ